MQRQPCQMAPHLIRHGCSARLLMSAIPCLVAKWHKKEVVSVDVRPPTSTPRTTRRAPLRRTTSSGEVRPFPKRALSSTTPSVFSASCGESSYNGERTPMWRPRLGGILRTEKREAHTTTSSLRALDARGSAKSKQKTMKLVANQPSASRDTLVVALSSANPLRSSTLIVHAMLSDRQTCRVGGHRSICATKATEAINTTTKSR